MALKNIIIDNKKWNSKRNEKRLPEHGTLVNISLLLINGVDKNDDSIFN